LTSLLFADILFLFTLNLNLFLMTTQTLSDRRSLHSRLGVAAAATPVVMSVIGQPASAQTVPAEIASVTATVNAVAAIVGVAALLGISVMGVSMAFKVVRKLTAS
jgi:hypothetical protein